MVVWKGGGSGEESQLTSFILDYVAWRFLSKLSELRKQGNRANNPQSREEPGRETTSWLIFHFTRAKNIA